MTALLGNVTPGTLFYVLPLLVERTNTMPPCMHTARQARLQDGSSRGLQMHTHRSREGANEE